MNSDQPTPKDPIGSDLVREDPSFADIVLQFVGGLGHRLTMMEAAIHSSDFEALQVAAHQLKASGGGYGYPILSERATYLEKKARAGVLEDCNEAFAELTQVCERIVVDSSIE